MLKRKITLGFLVILGFLLATMYWNFSKEKAPLKLFGSIDQKTVYLAFEEAGRISEVLASEGQEVEQGRILAKLDDERYIIALQTAKAAHETAQAEFNLLAAGPRAQEVDVAKAKLQAVSEQFALSTRLCERQKKMGSATSVTQRDQICSKVKVDQALLLEAQKSLDMIQAGARAEELAIAKARVKQAQVQIEDAQRALDNCVLKAPSQGIIRARLKEPGDMVNASAPAFELALTNPLWARVYIDEVNLGKIKTGQSVKLTVDSYPNQVFEATVGFISSVAEFTPKTVQTEEVRTSLVYEVRLTVSDPNKQLRLGMPVTAQLQ